MRQNLTTNIQLVENNEINSIFSIKIKRIIDTNKFIQENASHEDPSYN